MCLNPYVALCCMPVELVTKLFAKEEMPFCYEGTQSL